MTTPNTLLEQNIKTQPAPATVKRDVIATNNTPLNNTRNQPQEDTFNGKVANKKKIITYASVGTILATLVGIALDYRFAEGKHVKNLWKKLTGNLQDTKSKSNESSNIGGKTDVNTQNINNKADLAQPKSNMNLEQSQTTDVVLENNSKTDNQVQEFFNQEKKLLAETEEAKELSNQRNEQWLREQHKIKEQEYSDFWNKELKKAEEALKKQKEIEINELNECLRNEKLKFIERNKNNLPPFEQRYNEILKDMRTQYGGSFEDEMQWAKYIAKSDDEYLDHLFGKSSIFKDLKLKILLKQMSEEELQYFQKAKKVLTDRNLDFDEYELARTHMSSVIIPVAQNRFDGREAIGHGFAYKVNGALRLDLNPKDIIITLLDESFKSIRPLTTQRVAYRSVTGGSADKSIDFINMLKNAQKGDTFIDKGYSYSTFNPRYAVSCNGIRDIDSPEIFLEIIIPKGARISDGSFYSQKEILFPRNAKFKIIEEAKADNSYGEENNAYKMVIEYILP